MVISGTGRRETADRAVDRGLAPGEGLEALGDLRLEPLPVEVGRHQEERRHDEGEEDEDAVDELHRGPTPRRGASGPSACVAEARSTPVNSPIHFV